MKLLEVRPDGTCCLSNNDGITFKNLPMPRYEQLRNQILSLMDSGYQPLMLLAECFDQ